MSEQDYSLRYQLMQRYVGWSDDDAAQVAALWPLIAPHANELVDDFYAEIKRHPEASQVITGGQEQIDRLSQTLRDWLVQLFSGKYDAQYIARRWRVGHRHVEIGLAQRFTSLALSRLRTGIVGVIFSAWNGAPSELAAALASFNKLLDLDHALIQDAYEYEYVQRARKAERKRSEQRFRHLVENASCLILIFDSDHQAVYVNPYAEATTGLMADRDNDGKPHEKHRLLNIFGDDPEEISRCLQRVLAGEGPISYESLNEAAGKRRRWINWTLSRLDDLTEKPSVLAVGHDVTEQRHAARQLLQANRLATIGEMYARLAHESRNALQRLRVCTEMLADQVADSPDAAALVARAEQAQDDLQRLLDEVRNFASPIVLEPTECRLPSLWREAWNLLQSVRRDRRIELIEDVSENECRPLRLDRFRMVQAFRNIFENALIACDDPGAVKVRCRETTLDDAAAIEVLIEDNGPGFAEAALDQAFEPFFTTRAAGTGLGLAIVRRVIEAHGGSVAISNAQGGGARIAMRFQLVQTDRQASLAAASGVVMEVAAVSNAIDR